ncbi:hypothetical protein KEH51_29765 [[Brevibacterium] frigoritolerans]|uniref:Uncharacterized protein n=1 Tax=Peribacillus frigoritolerans TaxID=450367 RepID=A0A941FKN8_9BACI|nr:hypothetical protein [Peribacillus frigoritolerans]
MLKGRQWDAVIDTSGFIPRTVSKSCRLLNQVKHYTYIKASRFIVIQPNQALMKMERFMH